jgi:AraC-like DNA-binding protein
LIFYLSLPVIFVIALFLILDSYLLHKGKEQVFEQCMQTLRTACKDYSREFEELSKNSLMLMDSNSFKEVMLIQKPVSIQNNWKLSECADLLNTFVNTKDYIRSAGFISIPNGLYIASSGISTLDLYHESLSFGKIINRADYIPTYIQRSAIFQIQPLDLIDTGRGNPIEIIPLLQYNLGTAFSSSPLIINLDEESFSEKLKDYQPTAGSLMYIRNGATGEIIASTDTGTIPDVEKLLNNQLKFPVWYAKKDSPEGFSDTFYCFTVTSENIYSDELQFLLMVPHNDILGLTFQSLVISAVIMILCCFLGFLACYLISLKVYKPISRIIKSLEQDSDTSNAGSKYQIRDEIAYLDERIGSLMNSKKALENILNTALPTLHNRYITNILNNEEYDNLQLEPILARYPFRFPFPYFTCAILYVKFLPAFSDDFSEEGQKLIQQKFTDVLSVSLDEAYMKYIFKIQEHNYCIIYNSNYEDAFDLILNDFSILQNLFELDKDYIHLYMAIGSIIDEFASLHESYRKAKIAMSEISIWSESGIRIYQEQTKEKSPYILENTQENALSTLLFQGNEEEALTLTAEIISTNQKNGIGEESLKELYVSLYQIGKRTADRMNYDYVKALNDQYISLSTFLHDLSNLQRSSYISLFYQMLCRHATVERGTQINIEELKNYIDSHYTENLYLEMLADKYHTSPKYMSRLLKNVLGVPFKQYISNLQINHAKNLLSKTSMNIEEIALKSGFNGRNTFIRTFKLLEGITPGEYRKYNSKS